MNGGIYQIINLINGKRYVGSSVNLEKRRGTHWYLLRKGIHYNKHLQAAWNKYGENAFEFQVIGKCPAERLIELEQEVMDHLRPKYNMGKVAASRLGQKATNETRLKISSSLTGRVPSKETKRKISKSNLGHITSEETRRKIGIAGKGNTYTLGYKHSKETRRNMSEAKKGNTYRHGKKHSNEARRKMSRNRLGLRPSEEGRRNMSKAAMGRKPSDETRHKLSKALKGNTNCLGHKHSDETKRKISETKRRRMAEKRELELGQEYTSKRNTPGNTGEDRGS